MLYVTYFRPSDPNIGVQDCGGYAIHGTYSDALAHVAADAEAHGRTHASDAAEAAQYADAAASFRYAAASFSTALMSCDVRPSRRRHACAVGSIGAYIAEAATFHAEPNGGQIILTMHPAVADMIADALDIIGDDDRDHDDDRTYTCDTAYNVAQAIRRESAYVA